MIAYHYLNETSRSNFFTNDSAQTISGFTDLFNATAVIIVQNHTVLTNVSLTDRSVTVTYN